MPGINRPPTFVKSRVISDGVYHVRWSGRSDSSSRRAPDRILKPIGPDRTVKRRSPSGKSGRLKRCNQTESV